MPFTIRWVDLLKGEQNAPWFREKNPNGQIPLLELGSGRCLRESSAILLTLAEGSELLPGGDDRHETIAWLCFEQTRIDGIVSRARFRRLYPAAIPTPPAFFDAWLEEGNRGLRILDEHLAGRRFVVGDRFCIADIALYAYTHCAPDGGFDLIRYPAMQAWHDRIRGERGVLPLDENPEAASP